MKTRNWRNGTLLGLMAAALSTGCSADPGAAGGADDLALPTEVTTEAQGAMISQLGGLTISESGRVSALFQVMSSLSSLDFISIDSADLAESNVEVSLFAVDSLDQRTLVASRTFNAASAATSALDTASLEALSSADTLSRLRTSAATSGSSSASFERTTNQALRSNVETSSDVSRVVTADHVATADQSAENAVDQSRSASLDASAAQANALTAKAKERASRSASFDASASVFADSLHPVLGRVRSATENVSTDIAAASAAKRAISARDEASVDQSAASDISASAANSADASVRDAASSRLVSNQSVQTSESFEASESTALSQAEETAFETSVDSLTRNEASNLLRQTAASRLASESAFETEAETENLNDLQLSSESSTSFDQLQSLSSRKFLVQVSFDKIKQSANSEVSQTNVSASELVIPTIRLVAGAGGIVFADRSFAPIFVDP